MPRRKGEKPKSILQQAREEAGLTQDRVASLLGIDHRTYDDYESLRKPPSLQTAFRLSWLFGRLVEELFPEWDDSKDFFDPDQVYVMSLLENKGRSQ